MLVLDTYEHAYQMDFGTNAPAYVDTFFRTINWDVVLKRIEVVRNDQPLPDEDPSSTTSVPSLTVEELAEHVATGSGVQIINARQRDQSAHEINNCFEVQP